MKKEYEKPIADVISFQLNEDLTIDQNPSTGTGKPPWAQHDLGFDKSEYQFPIVP